uniref:MICOS complex subunit MIC10 n=1 Tax=Oncorhynchus mykiss TaxID=8022 RepID=A0A8K9XAM4_ONCMY
MSEKELGKKLDRCLADSAVKLGHTWPVAFGLGMGLGMAYTNCQNDLRYNLYVPEQDSLSLFR